MNDSILDILGIRRKSGSGSEKVEWNGNGSVEVWSLWNSLSRLVFWSAYFLLPASFSRFCYFSFRMDLEQKCLSLPSLRSLSLSLSLRLVCHMQLEQCPLSHTHSLYISPFLCFVSLLMTNGLGSCTS